MPKVVKLGEQSNDVSAFPVKHYSASSMVRFSTNPILFKIMDINGDRFDTSMSISAIIGQAFHKAMETYYGGNDTMPVGNESEAIEYGLKVGMAFLDGYNDGFITYTDAVPNKQKALELFAYGFNSYVSLMPYNNGDELVACEEKLEQNVNVEWRGHQLNLPVRLKGYADKIVRSNGKLKIKDYKTCRAFSDPDKIDGAKIIQAVMYYLLTYATYGEEPYSMTYEEVKLTKNKDGGPQVREYEMVFKDNDLYFDFFFRFYEDMTRALNGEMVFVPNINAFYDNEVAIISYIHRLDVSSEQAELMKKHKVDNLTDLLKKEIQSAGNMRKLMKSVEEKFVSAKNLNYEKMANQEKIQTKLLEHGMMLQFEDKIEGASVDLYRYVPSIGLKMSKLKGYTDDIEQVLGVAGIRVLAPIPGTSLVGFEVPRTVRNFPALPAGTGFEIAIGENVMGECYRFDIREAPHMIIAGSSGAGKSVFLNNVIKQLIGTPSVDLHIFDPKKVELNQYDGQVKQYVDDKTAIKKSLRDLVTKMEERYREMKKLKAKNIREVGNMRYQIIIIDEFAELAMGGEVGESIQSIAQMGRAAGMHLIIATQRASTKVIDGDTKVNFPTKVVFKMAKAVDSTVMLDEAGAEKLLGKGDMIFSSEAGMMRLQAYKA